MKEEDKYCKNDLNDFLRYTNGKMSDREKNDFERELQKDPFAEEAAEGLSRYSAEDVEKDLSTLGKKINRRVRKRSIFVVYRIAASVAVLMIISSVYIVVNRNRPAKESGETTEVITNPVTMEIPESEAIKLADVQEKKDKIAVSAAAGSRNVVVMDEVQQVEMQAPDDNALIAERKSEPEIILEKDEVFISVAENYAAEQAAPAPAKKEAMSGEYMAAAKSVSPVAYGRNDADTSEPGYTPPLPVYGKDSFDIYIEKNLRKPSVAEANSRVVVVINFLVRKTGVIDSIRVTRSPGTEFSDEVKRLILEGPSWNPAVRDGRKIDDEVSVRIVFK